MKTSKYINSSFVRCQFMLCPRVQRYSRFHTAIRSHTGRYFSWWNEVQFVICLLLCQRLSITTSIFNYGLIILSHFVNNSALIDREEIKHPDSNQLETIIHKEVHKVSWRSTSAVLIYTSNRETRLPSTSTIMRTRHCTGAESNCQVKLIGCHYDRPIERLESAALCVDGDIGVIIAPCRVHGVWSWSGSMPDRSTRSGKTTEQKSVTAYVLIMEKATALSSGIWTKKQQV